MKENCHREKNCESDVKTEPTEEINSGDVKCEIDEEVIKTEPIQNISIQKASLLSRFQRYDGGTQNFSTSDRIRSDPIGRKESPLQRKPRLNGLQNKTSSQSTLSQLRQYSSYSSEATGQNGSESRNELRKRPQSKVSNRERYSMANLFGPPTSKKQKVKAQSEAEGFFLGGSESDEDESQNIHEEFEKNDDRKTEIETPETSAEMELKDLVKKQKLFVEEGSEKEAILKDMLGREVFSCTICNTRVYDLKLHMRRVHSCQGPKFRCDICDKEYHSFKGLYLHRFNIHGDLFPYKCDLCPSEFKDNNEFKLHMKMHRGDLKTEWPCNLCGKKFKTKYILKNHLYNVHSDDKPWKCDICPATFKNQGNLRAHVMTHTGEKPFACEICDYRTVSQSKLDSHMFQHTKANKKHVCPICKRGYSEATTLKIHIRVKHANEDIGSNSRIGSQGETDWRESVDEDFGPLTANGQPFHWDVKTEIEELEDVKNEIESD